MRKRLSVLAAVVALALAGPALAGCAKKNHGPAVATLGKGDPTASASAKAGSGDAQEQGHKFAECMRGEGVDMPDPEVGEDGGMRVQIGSDGGDGQPPPDKAKLDAAQEKCKQYLPNGGEPPKLSPEQIEQARQFAKCMRENGVPNFPDPDASGQLRIEAGGDSGLDPQQVQGAQQKCDQYAPKRQGTDSGGQTGGGRSVGGQGLGGNG